MTLLSTPAGCIGPEIYLARFASSELKQFILGDSVDKPRKVIIDVFSSFSYHYAVPFVGLYQVSRS